uniref:Cytochrome c biogenesis protein CcsA n=1 Tax=Bryopsis sp. HV04063 TaxID=1979421 RepID=A0A2P0QH33_9CHLO|nr:cytochrome c biogenesis protein ccs1 [Bryopsis sp. HV04063]ARO74084.1 cytochrome c biogenesis protein ccs1 [Bryopsis sp. HV04063]
MIITLDISIAIENFINNFCFIILFITMIFYWFQVGFGYFQNQKNFSDFGFVIFLSWSLTCIHLIIQFITKASWIGCITSPTILFVNGFASFYLPDPLQKIGPLIPALKSNWLMMHVTVMLMSYAALISGCLLAITFLIIYNFTKIKINEDSKTFLLSLFPNKTVYMTLTFETQTTKILQNLDNLSYRIIGLGFPFLTIGILSGAVWANEAWGSYWSWDPKETWALITWLIFAIYLHTRLIGGWSGIKSSIIASLGFVVVWICYLGVNLLGKGLHSYGWFT